MAAVAGPSAPTPSGNDRCSSSACREVRVACCRRPTRALTTRAARHPNCLSVAVTGKPEVGHEGVARPAPQSLAAVVDQPIVPRNVRSRGRVFDVGRPPARSAGGRVRRATGEGAAAPDRRQHQATARARSPPRALCAGFRDSLSNSHRITRATHPRPPSRSICAVHHAAATEPVARSHHAN